MSQENLSNSAGPSCLKRSFGMREAVTITAGSVIGVGLFTTGSNVVGNLGIEVIFATLLADVTQHTAKCRPMHRLQMTQK